MAHVKARPRLCSVTGCGWVHCARGWCRNHYEQFRFPRKHYARKAVRLAITQGKLTKPSFCSGCGVDGDIHAHHDDYDSPLSVRWLCAKDHKAVHQEKKHVAD